MDIAEVAQLLKSALRRPIAYHKCFAEIAGKAGAGILLSQAWYWTPRTDDEDGWFFKTGGEWSQETGMSRTEIETARKRLIKLGLLSEALRGMPGKLHYRVNTEKLISLLVENPQTGRWRKPCKQVRRKPANKIAENPHTVLIAETTTETTRRAELYALPPDSMLSLTPEDLDWLRTNAPHVPDYDRAVQKWFLKQQTNGGRSKTIEQWNASRQAYMMNYSDGEQSRNGHNGHGKLSRAEIGLTGVNELLEEARNGR